MPLLPLDRILRDFTHAAAPATRPICADCLRYLLSGRAKFLGRPDPTRWRAGDVRALLLELAPSKLTEVCDLSGHGVPAVRAYLQFLDAGDYFHPGSANGKTLLRELDQAAVGYPAAMADESRFRLAKRFYTAMRDDGIDTEDDAAVKAWMETFNTSSAERRQALLSNLIDDNPVLGTTRFVAHEGAVAALDPRAGVDTSPWVEVPPEQGEIDFPAVSLPPEATLVAQARSSSILLETWQLAQWVSPRRAVTKNGELIPKDVRAAAQALRLAMPEGWLTGKVAMGDLPELSQSFRRALTTEVLALRRTGVIPGPRFDVWARAWRFDAAAENDLVAGSTAMLETWEDVFRAITEHSAGPTSPDELAERLQAWISLAAPKLLASLYARDQAKDVSELIAEGTRGFRRAGQGDDAETLRQALSSMLGTDLSDLERHGALRFAGTGLSVLRARRLAIADKSPGLGVAVDGMLIPAVSGLTVELTPLGTWALRRALLREGASAPQLTLSVLG